MCVRERDRERERERAMSTFSECEVARVLHHFLLYSTQLLPLDSLPQAQPSKQTATAQLHALNMRGADPKAREHKKMSKREKEERREEVGVGF